MKILSICSTDYNYEQAKGIIKWLKGESDSTVLRIPNLKNLLLSYWLLLIYYLFFRYYKFVKLKTKYDLIVVTGKSVVAQAFIIGNQLNIQVSCVQKPFGYPISWFKHQYIPYHDLGKNPAKNQIPTLIAPNTFDYHNNPNRLNRVSFLVGGQVHNNTFDQKDILNFLNDYNYPFELEVITSRRTPEELKKKIKYPIIYKYGSVKDAYYNSKIVIITDDSFSMISEAVQSGIKPYILKTKNSTKKHNIGIKKLEEENLIRYYNDELKYQMIDLNDYHKIYLA
jgi:mitochondrial fission protein ELM1